MRFTLAVLIIVPVLAACTPSDPDSGSGPDTTLPTTQAPPTTLPSVVEPDAPDNQPLSSSSAGDDGTTDNSGPRPGPCTATEVARRAFYAVSGIPAGDPDGGLNVRDSYDQGAIVATLPEDSVVFITEDCHVSDDGGVWWTVQAGDSIYGWVNSAYLNSDIPRSVPALGIAETEARVRTLLDALNVGDWGVAAGAVGAVGYATSAQLDDGGDLATQLERYCGRVICDAPYEIVGGEGIYPAAPAGWASPSVDVRFFYPGGMAIETFHGDFIEGEVRSLETLPGRSSLAYRSLPSTVAELVAGGLSELEEAGLYAAAERIRRSLLAEHGAPQVARFLPEEGMIVSSDAYIPSADRRVQITAAELLDGDAWWIWGYTDGLGQPIVDTVGGWMATYHRDLALLDPDVISIDERVGGGAAVANLPELFPNAHIVEFHREDRGDHASSNWSSVRIAVEQRAGEWKLMAITSDYWTI